MFRKILLLAVFLVVGIVAAQDDSAYVIPSAPDDVNLDLVIGSVGDQQLTLGEYVQRLRYDRLTYYRAMVSLAEQLGVDALDLNDENNQFAVPLRDLLRDLADDNAFPALVYDAMITEMLYVQEAMDRGLEIDECNVNRLWATRVGLQFFSCDDFPPGFEDAQAGYYDDAMTFAGYTPEEVNATIESVARYQAVIEALRDETPIEMVDARRTRQIRVDNEPLAQELYQRLLDGEDFDELMRLHTMDTGAFGNRGELGNIGRGDTIPQFEEAAFNAEAGEVVGPIRTDFGYHLVRVNERVPVATGRQIVVRDESDARQILQLLDDGAEFGELARRFSTDSSTRDRGGNLGAFTPDMVVRSVSDIIFDAATTGILDTIETEAGYHIIEILTFDPAGVIDVAHILLATEADALEVLAEIEAGADFNEAAETYSIDPSAAGHGGDTLHVFTGGAARGLYVPEETRLVFDSLVFRSGVEEGQIFAPVQAGQFWYILKLEEINERLPMPDNVELLRRFYVRDWESDQLNSDRVQTTTLWRRYVPFDLLPSQYDERLAVLDDALLQLREEFLSGVGSNNIINVLSRIGVENDN